jgi:hypothetical protein
LVWLSRGLVSVVLVAAALAASSDTAAAAQSRDAGVSATRAVGSASPGGPGPARVTPRIAWNDCGVRLECAHVQVPLDWAHPEAGTISLAVIRYVASRRAQRIGSLFVNGGGGTGSVELVRSEGARLDALGQGRFDVVGWALRGTAGAEPAVRCFADQQDRDRFWDGRLIPSTRAQSLAYLPKTIAYAQHCVDHRRCP